ncbi:MAG TPA: HNH endonuclease domain-containing protein [Pyrinomonadaceae bacterium]
MTPTAEEQVRFLLNLQRILQEGSFVATYKHALLLAIADVCVEKGDDSGATLRVTADELADKFISYYWRQAAPYHPAGRGVAGAVLKQNTGRQASVVNAVTGARDRFGSLDRLKANARAWRRLRSRVAETIRVMPLWKLQTVGRRRLEFLYGGSGGGEIELREGVCYCFRQFHGLVSELVKGAWLRFVRGVGENRPLLGAAVELSDFMFGSGRAPLEVYRPLLIGYQAGECFYCRRALKDRADVDHFVPWSRYPVDFGHNFVLAHASCNSQKGDRLAAVGHLERWCDRNARHGAEMSAAFGAGSIAHDEGASWRITEWAYGQAEKAGSLVWLSGKELTALTPAWRNVLSAAMKMPAV